MEVRRLGPGDGAAALAALRMLKRPPPRPTFDVETAERVVSAPDNILLLAGAGERPVGFLLAYVLDRIDRVVPMVCLYEIEVAAEHQRRGVGRALVDELKQICRELDALETWVVTNRSNVAAVGLYESTGAVATPDGDDVIFVYGGECWRRRQAPG